MTRVGLHDEPCVTEHTHHPAWHRHLAGELERLSLGQLRRQLHAVDCDGLWLRGADGRRRINLSGNDYLGLAEHPHLKAAAAKAIEAHGTGSGASRLVSGHRSVHESCEKRFASFKHAQAALLCPTGYLANYAVLTTLAQKDDLILADKLCHASLIDAARASGATLRTYAHLDLKRLERLLVTHGMQTAGGGGAAAEKTNGRERGDVAAAARPRCTFIVTDSVFSMDGDVADLPGLCELASRHHAILVVDEAHGTGLLGKTGSGVIEAQGMTGQVDVTISTASKALGSFGGIVTGSRVIIDTLVNGARSFIYTTATPASQPASIDAALDVIRDEPWRRARVAAMATELRKAIGLPVQEMATPIIPVIAGGVDAAMALAGRLGEAGFHAPAIRPPTVAPGTARVRISLRADLEDAHLSRLIDTLRTARP